MESYSNGLIGCLRRSSEYRRKRIVTIWSVILLAGLLVIFLAGCGAKLKPTKPTIEAHQINGMVCFSEPHAVALGAYLQALESQ